MRPGKRRAESSSAAPSAPIATESLRPEAERAANSSGPAVGRTPETVPTASATVGSERTRAGTVWIAITAFMVVLTLLLIFILQNSGSVHVRFLGAHGTMSLAVAMLFSAIAGALLVGLASGVRVLQLRRTARRSGHQR
jgi:uncharacterized integral membrane protein